MYVLSILALVNTQIFLAVIKAHSATTPG